jgi:hypothetical protein
MSYFLSSHPKTNLYQNKKQINTQTSIMQTFSIETSLNADQDCFSHEIAQDFCLQYGISVSILLE